MLATELRGKNIYMLFFLSILLLTLGYQVRVPFEIDLGGEGDSFYIDNFYDIETIEDLSFRWSSNSSLIVLPGLGGGVPALLQIRLNGWRPENLPPPRVNLRVNDRDLAQFAPSAEFETYNFTIESQELGFSGDLKVQIDSEVFVPNEITGGGDLRHLGVLVDSVSVELQGGISPIVTPAPLQTIYLATGVLALYLLARWVLSKRGALALAISILMALSLAIAVKRIYLAPHSFWVLVIPGLGLLIMELARLGPTMAKGIPLATALVLTAALGVRRFTSIASLSGMGIAPDFANNYVAATVLRSGGTIYDLDKPLFVGYDNPPLTAILTMPLTLFDLQTAIRLIFSLNIIFLLTSLALIFIARREYLLRYPYWPMALVLVINLDPVQDSMLLGQLDLLILLLMVISYWAYRNGRDLLAGLSLGLAAMIKLSPALLILYFLLKREFRMFASALVTMLLVGALSWFIVGTGTYILFITGIVPTLLAGSAQMENQSLNRFFNRLFLGPSLTFCFVEAPPLPRVRVLTLLVCFLLVGGTAFLIRKKLVSRDDLRFDLEFSMVVISLPLISSTAWHHYMAWYVLPFLVLLNPRLRHWLPRRTYLFFATAGFLFYVTLCIPITSYGSNSLEGPGELLLSTGLYGALALYGIFASS